MKKLIYKVEGYTIMYNPKTETEEEKLSLAEAVIYNPTEADIARATEVAYKGEYTIEDDGEPIPEATLETRVETLETDSTEMKEALDMILNGVTE